MTATEIIGKTNLRYREKEGKRKKGEGTDEFFLREKEEKKRKNGGVFLRVLRERVWVELQ